MKIIFKIILSFILVALLVIFATSITYIYDFKEPTPFTGPDIFNPYRGLDTACRWKRANFHTHTKVNGIFNECDFWPAETDEVYRKLGYDIVTFSNHNEITSHPYDTALQVNVYEHGINFLKFHKLVFGSKTVNHFDHLLPLFVSQKQFQIDKLAKDADFIQLNHPLRILGLSKDQLQQLEGFRIMELDIGKTTENEFWDWSLSSGHYSFGLANDDNHFPDRSHKTAIRSNFLCTPSCSYNDIKRVLHDGCFYSMRTPDYGDGNWNIKYAANHNLPEITDIGVDAGQTVFITLSSPADSIKITGQDHKTLFMALDTVSARYKMSDKDPYVRITAYLPAGEVIYTNPFARYDSSDSESPFRSSSHAVNIPLTIIFNLILLLLCAGDMYLIYRIIKK